VRSRWTPRTLAAVSPFWAAGLGYVQRRRPAAPSSCRTRRDAAPRPVVPGDGTSVAARTRPIPPRDVTARRPGPGPASSVPGGGRSSGHRRTRAVLVGARRPGGQRTVCLHEQRRARLRVTPFRRPDGPRRNGRPPGARHRGRAGRSVSTAQTSCAFQHRVRKRTSGRRGFNGLGTSPTRDDPLPAVRSRSGSVLRGGGQQRLRVRVASAVVDIVPGAGFRQPAPGTSPSTGRRYAARPTDRDA